MLQYLQISFRGVTTMDLDALFILLQPWLRPFLAFVFFTFLRYFYRAVLLRVLHRFNSKTSFEYGEDLLNAFEKPVHFFLFIFAIYAALNCSPLTFIADHPSLQPQRHNAWYRHEGTP